MKPVIAFLLILLAPLAARAQSRLYLRATIAMPATGNSDFQAYQSHGSGSFDDVMTVRLSDSLALVVGNDHDSLRNTWLDMQRQFPFAAPPPYPCTANCNFQWNSPATILTNIRINGETVNGISFALAIDSLRLARSSDSVWTVVPQQVPCAYICSYDNRYLMPNGENGHDVASGQGPTVFVASDPLSVRPTYQQTALRITSLENGAVQIESDASGTPEVLEVFDALGRSVFHTSFDGSAVRIANLRSGCYFAHLGSDVMKFAVMR